jgi:hypothetical protein
MKKTAAVNILFVWALTVSAPFLTGCQNAYYSTMEMFGKPKRKILVGRVEAARDSQTEAKEQFQSALEKFSEVVNFSGGELEEKYKKLDDEYQKSRSKAKAVEKRVSDVKNVAGALFKEWQDELEQYSNRNLRAASERKLEQTRQKYDKLIGAMDRAYEKIAPVLTAFSDQVLFLKHNLNARAVASLQDELDSVQTDIAALVREMEASIAEANAFIDSMTGEM